MLSGAALLSLMSRLPTLQMIRLESPLHSPRSLRSTHLPAHLPAPSDRLGRV
jgi:hypothetical protein